MHHDLKYQKYACAVFATSVQLWPIQVEELAPKHLLKGNCPVQNIAFIGVLPTVTCHAPKKGRASHHPYASFRGPCSFQNLILPSIAPSGRLQYSMKTPRMKGGKSSSSMVPDGLVTIHKVKVCWF